MVCLPVFQRSARRHDAREVARQRRADRCLPRERRGGQLIPTRQSWLDLRRYANLEDVEASVERVDPFSASGITQVSKRLSRFAWLKQSEDIYRLGLANGTVMWVEVDQLGQAEVFLKQRDTTRTSSGGFETTEEAFAFADSCVPVDAIGVALSTARWRTAAPSDKQAALIWRIDKQIRERFSSADAFHRYAVGRFRRKDKAFTKGAFSQRIDTYKFKLHSVNQ